MRNDDNQVVREAECRILTGLCRTTRYLMEKDGKFPSRRKIGSRAVGWLRADLIEWMSKNATVDEVIKQEAAKVEALTAEYALEIAADLLPLMRRAIRQRNCNDSDDRNLMKVIKTMAISLEVYSEHPQVSL